VPGFVKLWEKLGITHDDFIRTTDQRHQLVVTKILELLYKNGDLYEDEYSGWYCTPCETFWTKTQITEDKCPDCGRKVEYIKKRISFQAFKIPELAHRPYQYA